MKILYAIQGTGNGHLSRARDIIPILSKKGDLDILISGIQADVSLPYQVKYNFRGISFIFGKHGGVDILKTIFVTRPIQILKEIYSLPVNDYDIILNDFEPISAWACRIRKKKCIALSHQSALKSKVSPKPKKKDIIGWMVLNFYAPSDNSYGFHFNSYSENIYTPVIRSEIRNLKPKKENYYTVYLPSYNDKRIINFLLQIPDTNWEVFSKHNKNNYKVKNIHLQPIQNEDFIKSLESCSGVLCGAGFETPAEALYLGKKLLVIPMRTQYEQHCNAKALEDIGVKVVSTLSKKNLEIVKGWVREENSLQVNYPDITEKIIDKIFLENSIEK